MKINLKIIDPKKADDGSRYVQKHRIGGRDILVFNRQNNEFLSDKYYHFNFNFSSFRQSLPRRI
jgi:hypothetical protein